MKIKFGAGDIIQVKYTIFDLPGKNIMVINNIWQSNHYIPLKKLMEFI